MFGVSGVGLANIKYYQNGKKRARRSLDQWDRQSTFAPNRMDEAALPR